jgi:hypothetical protein
MIDPISTWKSTMAALVPSTDPDAALTEFAKWVDERVTNKMSIVGVSKSDGTESNIFVFNKSIFETQLKATCVPTTDVSAAASKFADAWEQAMLASTMAMTPGFYVNPPVAPTPATQWSVVTSLIDPLSITAAKIILVADMTSSMPTSDPNNSGFPAAFRNAFVALKVNIVGMNSVTPTPTPLNMPGTPVA